MTIRTRVVVARPGSAAPVLEDGVLQDPVGHEVLVKISATGVCQSQLHQLANAASGAVGNYIRALGHEAVGIVEAAGENVGNVRPGQSVLLSWIPESAMMQERAVQPARVRLVNGAVAQTPDVFTWATRTVVDEAYLFPLSVPAKPEVSVIGCAVATGAGAVLHTGGLVPGQSVAVIGVGGVGINAVAAARAAGAAAIVALDVDPAKLAYARTLGATVTVDTSCQSATHVLADHGLTGIDLVVDCVAMQDTLDLAIDIVRPGVTGVREGGAVVLVGIARGPLTIDARQIQMQEKRILGSFGGSSVVSRDFPQYLEWAQDGALNLSALVSRSYRLDDVENAVDDLRDGRILGRGVITL